MESQKSSTLFVRAATGLVRAWSVTDAFIYAFFSINLITLGLYIFSQMYYLDGNMIGALIVSAVFITFECVVYASLIAVMPRAGGDYVWQSRILSGAVGFILAVAGWWFILWYWVPLYSDMLRYEVITPILALLGAQAPALWFTQEALGSFVSVVLVCSFVFAYIAMGMRNYARLQKFCFFGGLAGLLVVFLFLLFGNNTGFKEGLESQAPVLFGAQGQGLYDATIAAGQEAGTAQTWGGGWAFGPIFLAIPYLVFFNLWPNWGATLYGEVRGATDFKRNFNGMWYALLATTALGILFFILINKTITWDFYANANGAFWNWAWGYTDVAPPLPVWPYPALLAAMVVKSRLLQILVILAMALWFFGWSGTVFLSSTRVIFAAAFDRLLPEWVADIHPKMRTPINALLLMVIPGLIVGALYAWNIFNFQSLTLCSTLVITITYLGSTIAAILLPYVKKDLYNASPIAKYKWLGIPMITLAGLVFLAFLVFLLYEWFIDPLALYGIGISNTSSIIFMGAMYVLAAVLYFGFKAYRKRQGIDIKKVYEEIPVE